jgi:hypothetical protein
MTKERIVLVRLKEVTHKRLKVLAARLGLSLDAAVSHLLAAKSK